MAVVSARDPWDDYMAVADMPAPDENPLGLSPRIAAVRDSILENRMADRLEFCARNGLDPATFHGCHGCGGTGWHWDNNLPCWCDQGRSALRFIDRRESDLSVRLVEKFGAHGGVKH